MFKQAASATLMVVFFHLSGSFPVAGQEASQSVSISYRIKPSEVIVPPEVPLGQYRRSIRPFGNWTLICDENLHAKKMVCNVSQVIVDQTDALVFSWSLAATRDGKPFMVLRTAPNARPDGKISLRFPGRVKPVDIALEGCNTVVCVGKVAVGPIFREQISKESTPQISYSMTSGQSISVTASLKGLGKALSVIN
ncbi:invasion associated locus B family protein [Ochrobactrum quorumnocens]|uniref:Invasion associated locus B family protein n=1 Tax=Ochrobactrum quorumnocens TaxID=271865 RepID=A0A248UC58_9HYPH|nr:invasion associated locus B family protein [[Ochrobactrum] quorumnocens]ASV84182.1 invasion associated locus B family protein [[Ochrobactrum] quorumnocens]